MSATACASKDKVLCEARLSPIPERSNRIAVNPESASRRASFTLIRLGPTWWMTPALRSTKAKPGAGPSPAPGCVMTPTRFLDSPNNAIFSITAFPRATR